MDGYVTIGTEIDTKNFDAQIKYIESKMQDIEDKLKQADMGFEVGDTQKLEAEYERLGNQLISLKQKQEKYNQSINESANTNFANVQGQLSKIGNGIDGITKKVTRWGLAIFGIRSAYNFVRQSMSTLSQYNEQMATDVEWLRYVIASTLKPVIEGIIKLVHTLLSYINYIAQAWFGVNLFANASVKEFQKANSSLKKTNKTAKELQKTLTGFDEMNILQDNKSSSGDSGGGGGSIKTPSVDLASFDLGGEPPAWLKWIAENKDLVISAIAGLTGALISMKLLGLDPIMGLGIGLIIAGIVRTIQAIIKFIKDPSWENFAGVLEGLAIILAGVAVAMVAVNAANPVAWIVLAIAAIVALAAIIIKNWDKVKVLLGKIIKFVSEKVIKPIANFFSGLFNGIINAAKGAIDRVMAIFKALINFYKGLISSILGLFKTIGVKVGDVISSAFKGVVNGVMGAIETILNAPIRAINGLIRVINKVPGINLGKLDTFDLPRLAKGGIINQPGRGVMVGSAIAGERGAEGVIPLTDSQQMALLGEAIGRYITITANITNTMNGRVISREIKRIGAEQDFAYNR